MTGQFISAGDTSHGDAGFLQRLPYLPSNALFFAYFSTCMQSSRVTWLPDPAALLSHRNSHRRPLVYYAWHGDSWWLIAAILALPAELRPVGVCNDGVISRLNSRAGSWLGIDMFEYVHGTSKSPRRQLIDFVRDSGRHLMIFPDAGGPYRQLKPGILAIARETNADLVPLRLDASPALSVGRIMQHRVPIPFARLRVHWGTPLEAGQTSTAMAEAALRALSGESAAGPD